VNGGETTIVGGLEKPVGILALGGKLYVGDQPTRKIYSVDLADPALVLLTDEVVALDQFAASDQPDSFFALAYDETLMTGYVYRVNIHGSFTVAAQGAWEPRGIAFDGVSRIFVSERDVQRIAVVPAC
jgi:S-adenosylmethionine:diacylglycerol 3-amino-3-carboxypropyl transferase